MKKIFIAMIAACTMIMAANKTAAQNLHVGSPYKGGIVAYLLVQGDSNYSPKVQHGLLASATNIKVAGLAQFEWCQNNVVTGAVAKLLYGGVPNTTLIVTKCQVQFTAAGVCYDYSTPQLTTGWYLPDETELNILYKNRNLIGGFSPHPYWSSNESSATLAQSLSFSNGNWYTKRKTDSSYVRAIHVF